ncbi:MAG: hypothetical protein AAFR12_02255 [Cyanobacteria bacterium J06626_6]
MQRFILSACSVLLATAAVATEAQEAQALSKVDSAFNLQTLRLEELDTRNKSDESSQPYYSQPYYSQPSTEPSSQSVSTEQERTQTTESAVWENADTQEQLPSPAISLLERRHQSLDRRS